MSKLTRKEELEAKGDEITKAEIRELDGLQDAVLLAERDRLAARTLEASNAAAEVDGILKGLPGFSELTLKNHSSNGKVASSTYAVKIDADTIHAGGPAFKEAVTIVVNHLRSLMQIDTAGQEGRFEHDNRSALNLADARAKGEV